MFLTLQMIAPFFAELATSFKGKMVFLKVDVDANEVRRSHRPRTLATVALTQYRLLRAWGQSQRRAVHVGAAGSARSP